MNTSLSLTLKILNRYSSQKTNLSVLINSSLKGVSIKQGYVRSLVWGVVKRLNTIDWLIDKYSKDPQKIKLPVRNILRLGIFQLLFYSDKMPGYAAVNETVELARAVGQPQAAKYVNAVLREAGRNKDNLPWPDYDKNPVKRISLEHSHPEWMVSRWMERFGDKETIDLCRKNNETPGLCVRVNTLKASRDDLKAILEKDDVKSEYCRYSPDGLILLTNPEIEKLECYKEGLFVVQDEASQLVSQILAPFPGNVVLDLCSGSGTKTAHLAQLSENRAFITAVDTSQKQTVLALENFKRLGIKNVYSVENDACSFNDFEADCILIDAPCSGLGVIRRKNDIKWNRTQQDVVSRYPQLQKKMLSNAAKLLKPGGVMVYSTCSTEPEENQDVVNEFISLHPEFKLEDVSVEGITLDNSSFMQTFPHKHNLDGFFAVRMKKN